MDSEDTDPTARDVPIWPISVDVPTGIQLNGPDFKEDARMLLVLGAVIRAASMADLTLRILYVALVGSPYANVTAAGQMTAWLRDECIALVKYHTNLDQSQKDKILDLLSELGDLSRKRNRLVHDLWVSGEAPVTLMQSPRREMGYRSSEVDLEGLVKLAERFTHVSVFTSLWTHQALPQRLLFTDETSSANQEEAVAVDET